MGKPPTLTDMFQSKIVESEKNEEKEKEESKKGVKRKIDEFYEENVTETQTENGQKLHDKHIKKAKNVGSFFLSISTSLCG